MPQKVFLFKTIGVYLKYIPFIEPKLDKTSLAKSYTPNVGGKFKLFCYLKEGQQPVTFTWLKSDRKLAITEKENYRINSLDETSILSFSNLSASDSSDYSCSVLNAYGNDVLTTSLRVQCKLGTDI